MLTEGRVLRLLGRSTLNQRETTFRSESWSGLPGIDQLRPLRRERAAENTGQAHQRVAPADTTGVVGAIADYLAIGAEHGILQIDRIDIRFFNGVHGYRLLIY